MNWLQQISEWVEVPFWIVIASGIARIAWLLSRAVQHEILCEKRWAAFIEKYDAGLKEQRDDARNMRDLITAYRFEAAAVTMELKKKRAPKRRRQSKVKR